MTEDIPMKLFFMIFLLVPQAFASMTGVRDACEDQNWARVRCEFLNKNPYGMNYRAESMSGSRLVDIGGWLGTLNEQLENINNPELSCVGDSGRLARLTQYTRRIIAGKNLTNCQKACVVKCITSNYITYGPQPEGKNHDSPCQAANSGKGVCRAYSNLADHLMDEIGLRSQSRSSVTHAYNKIWLNGRWYYGEPQDSRCQFFLR